MPFAASRSIAFASLALALFTARGAFAETRHHPLTKTALGPWYGSGCPANGKCGCATQPGATLADEFLCQMDHLAQLDLPITMYLFDGPAWAKKNSFSWPAPPTCSGADCCVWNLGQPVIDRLAATNVRAMLHFWGGCHTPEQYARAAAALGNNLYGFYLDEASSDAEAKQVVDWLWRFRPGDSEATLKANQGTPVHTTPEGLRAFGNLAYVGDCHYDWEGLRDGIRRLFLRAALVPAPFNEFTGYWYPVEGSPPQDGYFRRLHFGALQPVMANTPFGNSDPWKPGYDPQLVTAYRFYAWLHKELVPYLYSYAINMHEHPSEPVLRSPNADQATVKLGDELFVAYVTRPATTWKVTLPPGTWIDYWDESRELSGIVEQPVPLGREPIFVKNGAIIPLDVERAYAHHGTAESKGSLTVLVYPSGASTFRLWDDADRRWVQLRATADGTKLTLAHDPIAKPVIWRVARWGVEPKRVVAAEANTLTVDGGAGVGRPLPRKISEAEVITAHGGGWFYDAAAKRLIVRSPDAAARPVGRRRLRRSPVSDAPGLERDGNDARR